MKLISDTDLSLVEAHLGRVLDRLLEADGLAPMRRVIRGYVLAGGKRIRPQLCVWTWARCLPSGPEPAGSLPAPLLDLACAWELFHAFLLAHDDIIDAAAVRREQASLHRQLAALDGNCPRFGTNLGIVAGDLLFSAAVQLWHELDVPDGAYRDLLRLFSRIATTTGFGQAIDICQSHVPIDDVEEETLLREYHWKTAAYTFEGPMLSGAVLAGADDASRSALSRYALALGQAYQLQNDLLDLALSAHEGSDLVQGKRTVTLIRARQEMTPARRREFDRKLDRLRNANGAALPLAEELRRELLASSAAERTQERIDAFLSEAASATSNLPPALAHGLTGLLTALRRQYFHPLTAPPRPLEPHPARG